MIDAATSRSPGTSGTPLAISTRMDIPASLYGQWEQQHIATERSRMLAKMETEQRVARAKARVEAALRALEYAARLEGNAMR
jgi:hypothetical protein